MSATPLSSRTVQYGDVTFQIGKLLPMEAKRVFMNHVRPLLRGALSADVKDDAGMWQLILAAFTDAPQEHYDAVQRALYGRVRYSRPGDTAPTLLLGDEENAFKDLDMVHALLLDARAFMVNFGESWRVAISEFPSLVPALQSSGLQMSTPSSADS